MPRDPSPVGLQLTSRVSDLRHYARVSAITGEWSATHLHVYIICVYVYCMFGVHCLLHDRCALCGTKPLTFATERYDNRTVERQRPDQLADAQHQLFADTDRVCTMHTSLVMHSIVHVFHPIST